MSTIVELSSLEPAVGRDEPQAEPPPIPAEPEWRLDMLSVGQPASPLYPGANLTLFARCGSEQTLAAIGEAVSKRAEEAMRPIHEALDSFWAEHPAAVEQKRLTDSLGVAKGELADAEGKAAAFLERAQTALREGTDPRKAEESCAKARHLADVLGERIKTLTEMIAASQATVYRAEREILAAKLGEVHEAAKQQLADAGAAALEALSPFLPPLCAAYRVAALSAVETGRRSNPPGGRAIESLAKAPAPAKPKPVVRPPQPLGDESSGRVNWSARHA